MYAHKHIRGSDHIAGTAYLNTPYLTFEKRNLQFFSLVSFCGIIILGPALLMLLAFLFGAQAFDVVASVLGNTVMGAFFSIPWPILVIAVIALLCLLFNVLMKVWAKCTNWAEKEAITLAGCLAVGSLGKRPLWVRTPGDPVSELLYLLVAVGNFPLTIWRLLFAICSTLTVTGLAGMFFTDTDPELYRVVIFGAWVGLWGFTVPSVFALLLTNLVGRTHRMSIGDSLSSALLLRVSVRKEPPDTLHCFRYVRRVKYRWQSHSAIYSDDSIVSAIAEWMVG
jgi:hypothetical protein